MNTEVEITGSPPRQRNNFAHVHRGHVEGCTSRAQNVPLIKTSQRTRGGMHGGIMTCSVCSHEHVNFIDYFLTESPYNLDRISMFYEIPVSALEYHKQKCLRRS